MCVCVFYFFPCFELNRIWTRLLEILRVRLVVSYGFRVFNCVNEMPLERWNQYHLTGFWLSLRNTSCFSQHSVFFSVRESHFFGDVHMHVFPYTPSVGSAWINSRRCSAQLMTLFLWPLMSYLSYYANKPRKQATQGNSEPNTACFFWYPLTVRNYSWNMWHEYRLRCWLRANV